MGGDDGSTIARLLAVVEAQAVQQAATNAQLAALTQVLTAERRPAKPASITLARLFEHFEKTRVGMRSYMKNNRNRLVPLIRRLGELPADQLTPLVWAEHKAARSMETHRYGTTPKEHTLTVELQRARELLNFGVEAGFLESSPLEKLVPPKTKSARETWLDEAGVLRLLDGVAALPDRLPRLMMRAFILLCVDGMMRFNEARLLRRDQIRDGVVELSAKGTKSKRRRFVGLTPRTLEAIAAIPPVLGDPRIFANPDSDPDNRRAYSRSRFSDWFRIVRYESGVNALAVDGERVVVHTLRHSGASAADARGASPMAIKDALGHSSLAITERYLHRHRATGAKDLARIMAEGSERERERERERRGPQAVPRDDESAADGAGRTSNR